MLILTINECDRMLKWKVVGRGEKEREDERGMEDTEVWPVSFVSLPDRKQTYRLKTETDTQARTHPKKHPRLDV